MFPNKVMFRNSERASMDWEESPIHIVCGVLYVLHIGIKIGQFWGTFITDNDGLEDPEQPSYSGD